MKTKIKSVSILTVFTLLLSILYLPGINVQAVDMPSVTYTISSNSIKTGDNFTVTVNVNNLTDFYGASLDFLYDNSNYIYRSGFNFNWKWESSIKSSK